LREALAGSRIEWAAVYGSIATGSATAGSDVDLLIVGDVSLREIASRLRSAQDTLGREIVPAVWTVKEFHTRQRNRDPFLARVLKSRIIPVVGNPAVGKR
jgi:predicted nucleotidyltransferase